MNAVKKKNEVVLEELRNKMDEYTEKFSQGTALLKKLDTQLTFLKSEISQNRSKLKFTSSISAKVFYGHNAVKENLKNTRTLLTNLEKRQHGLLLRSSEWDMVNRRKMEKIDKMRHRQTVCKMLDRKLSQEFKDIQRDLAETFTYSSEVYEERQNIIDKIAALRKTADLEVEAFNEEMESLARYIREQNMITEQLKNVGTRVLTSKKKDYLSKEEEERLRHEMHHHEPSKYTPPSALDYQIAFDKLLKESGLESVNELVMLYIQRFDDTFNLYSFVQQQKSDVFAAQNALDHARTQLQKYIDSEGELHKKQLSMVSTVKAQKKSLLSGIQKTNASLETHTRLVKDWCAQVQSMVNSYLKNATLLRSEDNFASVLRDIMLEYQLKNAREWKVPVTRSSRRPEVDEDAGGDAVSKRRKPRDRKNESPLSPKSRKMADAKSNRDSAGGDAPRSLRERLENVDGGPPPLITSRNLEKALSSIEEMCLSILKKVVSKVSKGGSKDVSAVSLDGFIGPASSTQKNIVGAVVAKMGSMPTSTFDSDDELDEEYDIKLVDLGAYRKEFETKMTKDPRRGVKDRRARKRGTTTASLAEKSIAGVGSGSLKPKSTNSSLSHRSRRMTRGSRRSVA